MNQRYGVLLRTIPFLIIGLLFFVLYLVLFVDIPEMINELGNANLSIYSLAACALVFDTLLFTLSWYYLLLPLSVRISLKKIFMYVWIGVFADLLIPAESVSGEVAKAYLLSKEPNVNPGKVIASLVSQRMLGTTTTTLTLFLGFLGLLALNFPMSDLVLQILVAMAIITALASALLVTICVKERWTERLVNVVMRFVERVSRGRFKLENYQTRIVDALRAFHGSLRVYGSKPRTLLPPICFHILAWISSISIVFLVFLSLGYLKPNLPILFLQVVVVYTLLIAVKSIPIGVPAEVGLPDIFMTTMFILFGIPPDISAAATVLTRILTLWLRFFIGFAAVQWLGFKSLMESGVFGRPKDKV